MIFYVCCIDGMGLIFGWKRCCTIWRGFAGVVISCLVCYLRSCGMASRMGRCVRLRRWFVICGRECLRHLWRGSRWRCFRNIRLIAAWRLRFWPVLWIARYRKRTECMNCFRSYRAICILPADRRSPELRYVHRVPGWSPVLSLSELTFQVVLW